MKLNVFKNGIDVYNYILDNNIIESKVLLLPTGNTPLGLYKEIIKRNIDMSGCTTFNLDEYYPIEKDNVDSYHYYMWNNLFKHTNIKLSNVNLLDGNATDIMEECSKYSKKLLDSNVDIAFLGIGVNGHIAFNEPHTEPHSEPLSLTRLVDLTESTKIINNIKYNSALTVGISEILSSKKIIMLALGESKANIIYELLNSTETSSLPASYLLNHPNFELYVDEMAFSKVLSALSKPFMNYNKMLIFSPHPDDDVIGMGTTIKKFIDSNKDITIVYQTSGSNAGNTEVRQREAIDALDILGLTDKIIFADTPFYKTNDIDMVASIKYTNNIINTIKPDVIFFAGDVRDPHRTHLKCFNIIQECLKQNNIPAYNYYSAWSSSNNYDVKEYFSKDMMSLKIESIKAHKSQINPIFSGDMKSEFYEIIETRNRRESDIYHDIYMEGFNFYNMCCG